MEQVDIAFLCKVTSLPYDKLILLAEENFNEIADAVSEKEQGLAPISMSLFSKLTIFRETKNCDFSLDEKAYVADCVATHYPTMFHKSHYLIDKGKLTEKDGQYYLVLIGMFPEFLIGKNIKNGAPNIQFYSGIAKNIFVTANREILANHVDDWVDLLYYIKKYCWR